MFEREVHEVHGYSVVCRGLSVTVEINDYFYLSMIGDAVIKVDVSGYEDAEFAKIVNAVLDTAAEKLRSVPSETCWRITLASEVREIEIGCADG